MFSHSLLARQIGSPPAFLLPVLKTSHKIKLKLSPALAVWKDPGASHWTVEPQAQPGMIRSTLDSWEKSSVCIKSYSSSPGVPARAATQSPGHVCLTSSRIHANKFSVTPETTKKLQCSWSICRGGSKQKIKSAGSPWAKRRARAWGCW